MLEIANRGGILQRQANFVQAVEQTMLMKAVDGKWDLTAIGFDDLEIAQIEAELIALGRGHFSEQLINNNLIQNNGKKSILYAIVKKYI
ncbi:MAG: hypothetical protein ACSLE5_14145, partial [Porticoccaceae bacterium]